MIHPIIFAYDLDASCTVEAAGAAIEAGFKPPWIFNDARRPVPVEVIGLLQQMGCTVRPFTRKTTVAGQYGRDCAFGLAEAYHEVLQASKDDYVMKLDCDTVVLRTGYYREAISWGVIAAGWAWEGWVYSGCCNLISQRGVKRLLDFHRSNEPYPLGLSADYCPSDVMEYAVLKTVERPHTWTYQEEGGFGAGYAYGNAKVSLKEYARRFDVVTFGQRYLLTGEEHERHEHVARTMSAYRSIYRNMKK